MIKNLFLILIYLIAAYFFTVLNLYNYGWQFVQPFLIAALLIYFNVENNWLYYGFALLAGLFIDSLSGVFGLHALIFLFIIFILKTLQLTILTSKNILTIILLTILAFVLFWLIFWGAHVLFGWGIYLFDKVILFNILKTLPINISAVIILHVLFYNFWIRKHGQRQSF